MRSGAIIPGDRGFGKKPAGSERWFSRAGTWLARGRPPPELEALFRGIAAQMRCAGAPRSRCGTFSRRRRAWAWPFGLIVFHAAGAPPATVARGTRNTLATPVALLSRERVGSPYTRHPAAAGPGLRPCCRSVCQAASEICGTCRQLYAASSSTNWGGCPDLSSTSPRLDR
jgi:hypothetical protein